ncbi:MAG: hypothetical protein IJW82_02655 [Clostridia bacterium]|nr:hypothetical protein [Clostridia bacterium]
MEKKRNVHAGHFARLRKQFVKAPDAFSEHQVLELLLSFGSARRDVNPLAHELLFKYGSISKVCDVSSEELLSIKGVSKKMVHILKSLETISMYLDESEEIDFDVIDSNICKDYLMEHKEDYKENDVYVVSLTNAGFFSAEIGFNLRGDKEKKLITKLYNIVTGSKGDKAIIIFNSRKEDYTITVEDLLRIKRVYLVLETLSIGLVDCIFLSENDVQSLEQKQILNMIRAIFLLRENRCRQLINLPINKMFLAEKISEFEKVDASREEKLYVSACKYFDVLQSNELKDLFN